MPYLLLLAFLCSTTPVLAEGFRCAGSRGTPLIEALPPVLAAKPARMAATITGTRRALVLFARFKGDPISPVPSWASDLFKPNLPGSIAHFYDTMSFGVLQLRGAVGPRMYESAQPASAYLENDQTPEEDFGRFSLEILRQADRDLDLAQFDNDGPDGVPDSGDDDGVVDAVFLVLDQIPTGFLIGEATGIKGLGFTRRLVTEDTGKGGGAIQILPQRGTIQQGRSFTEAVGSMCHEYGHVLGLPDLYNTDFLAKPDAGPEEDSAGVGAWCLMGWGATGWKGNDGPNSFCAWSRMKLGWALEVAPLVVEVRNLALLDEDRDQQVLAGEQVSLNFALANVGGLPAREVKARLSSDDPWVEIEQAESSFEDLEPGRTSFGAPKDGFPSLRMRGGFIGVHQARVVLEVYAGQTLVSQRELEVAGLSPRQQISRVVVVDSLGNNDGLAQGGETG
ncbi:MAG: immune inhibitor A [Candidatus Latescibacteria bacterium]|nr:immune inhibitor A [Candidatus Latescibacterota bacterium]